MGSVIITEQDATYINQLEQLPVIPQAHHGQA